MHEFAQSKDRIKPAQKIIVMRHDIDQKVTLARNFASIEEELGIRATYFVRLHADYNPFSVQNYAILKEIIGQGHEIGLHYEGGFSMLFRESQSQSFERDLGLLEKMIRRKVHGFSFHEPRRSKCSTPSAYLKKEGIYDAYSNTFMGGLKYISDSSANWREGCMCNFVKSGSPRLYILTHPFWWFNKTPLENY